VDDLVDPGDLEGDASGHTGEPAVGLVAQAVAGREAMNGRPARAVRDTDDPPSMGDRPAVPGPFLLHAVGVARDPESRNATEQALSQVHAAAQSTDIGLAAASFAEGRAAVADGLDSSALRRLVEVRTCVDPDRRIASSRILAAVEAV
jgi:hypothetical protein